MSIDDLKEKVAYSCNILAIEGHWDQILGHVTARIPGEQAFFDETPQFWI